MVKGNLMKVESIAECSLWSIMQYFWPALSNNRSWKPIFWSFLSGSVLLIVKFIMQKSNIAFTQSFPILNQAQ